VADAALSDALFAFQPVSETEFVRLIQMVRADRHAKLTQTIINRPGALRVTAYLVNGDPIAASQVRGREVFYFKRIA